MTRFIDVRATGSDEVRIAFSNPDGGEYSVQLSLNIREAAALVPLLTAALAQADQYYRAEALQALRARDA